MIKLWSAVGDNTERTQERIGRSISGILREIESGMLMKRSHLENGMRLFKGQSTDLNKAQTGRCAHGKATKLLILPDDKA